MATQQQQQQQQSILGKQLHNIDLDHVKLLIFFINGVEITLIFLKLKKSLHEEHSNPDHRITKAGIIFTKPQMSLLPNPRSL